MEVVQYPPPPPSIVRLRTDGVTYTYYTSFSRESSGDPDLIQIVEILFDFAA